MKKLFLILLLTCTFVFTSEAQTTTLVVNALSARNTAAPAGNLIAATAGKTLQIKTGTNACAGSATLSSGTVTVSTTCTGTTWGFSFACNC